MTVVPIGKLAPDFELPLHTGELFHLSQYRGSRNVVLYFYPKDFTSGCTREGCLFTSHVEEVLRRNSIIIGISADTIESHKGFAAQYQFGFPLASDVEKTVCRSYGALWLGGLAIRRITYIIDKKGIVRGRARYELRIDHHWDYVLSVLKQIEGEA